MDPERWRRVKALFHEALERPAADREPFLAAACADDPALHEHLRQLLAAHEETSDRLEGGALQAALPALYDELHAAAEGLRIGPYRVIEELGRGGMGTVYLAARDDGAFEQQVAVKLIKRGMDTDEIVRRFVHERQILASLVHPHIARLLDGGTTDDGRPYFVMEHIDGQPVTAFAEQEGMGVEARLRLFLEIAAAVQFAHQSLVVHRDLKPANILVGRDGAPKLLDFGIAKLLGAGLPGARTQWTALDAQPLTPDYASPEQLGGRPVTTATDVYGLGLLLYELLLGVTPAAARRELGPGAGGRPASQVARALSKARGNPARGELERLARRLRGDLDTILGKALAADPAHRYGTVAELAEDLGRHLSHRPVKARRPTVAYRLGRTVMRHRLASAFVLSLVAFSAAVTWQALAQERLRLRAEATSRFLVALFKAADPEENRGEEITVREALATGAKLLQGEPTRTPWLARQLGDLTHEPGTRAELLETIGEVQFNLGLDEAERSLRKALEIRSRQAGREARLETARIRNLLGDLYRERDDYARSRRLYQAALDTREELLGRRSLPAAESLNGLGLVAYETEDWKAAEALFLEALAVRKQAPAAGEGRLGYAETLNNLGLLAIDQGRLPQAARYLEEALAAYRRLLGEDHPRSVRVLGNVAVVSFLRGDYARAAALYGKVLEIRRRVLGPDHPDLARTWSTLGAIEEKLGRWPAAEASVRQALALRERLSLTADADYAEALASLAGIVAERGELAEAARLYGRSLELYRRLLGDESTDVAMVLNGTAAVELARGEIETADRTVRRALAIRRRAYGPGHEATARSLHLLARVLAAAGRPEDAEAAFREALAVRRQKLGPAHSDTAESLVDLGGFLLGRGRPGEALPLLEEGLGALRRAFPAEHAEIGLAEVRLGAALAALGRRGQARPRLESGYRILLAARGGRHPETVEAARRLRELAADGPPLRPFARTGSRSQS
jgi:tetratricopeptide (TPR) repeat protein